MICARAVASAIVTPDTNTNTDPVTPDTNTSTVTPDTNTDTAIVTPDTDTDTATPDTDTAAATDKHYDTGSGAASQDGHRGCLCRFRYKTCGE
jgi:hypothetical protein